MTYQLMFYGGIIGVLITLPLAIYLFIKLQITHVFHDLTGLSFSGNKKKVMKQIYSETDGELKDVSSEIKLRKHKKELTNNQMVHESELLGDVVESTVLLHENSIKETMLLTADETTLLGENLIHSSANQFVIEKNVMVVHSVPIITEESELVEEVY